MTWNWQLAEWPKFNFNEQQYIENEAAFMRFLGRSEACFSNISKQSREQFKIEILCLEGTYSAKIEGEILDRESLQSSIRKQFGLDPNTKKESIKEAGMAEALLDAYKTYDQPLDHATLFRWHQSLFKGSNKLEQIGSYRTHEEPMQIVSNKLGSETIFFEAPPSKQVYAEMERFLDWYNQYEGLLLVKAAIAHVYFESIHPFEDGNGRIGRLIVEKTLSKGLYQPVLIAISKLLEYGKKEYYKELEKCNCTLNIDEWILYFTNKIIEAQINSMKLLEFIILKSKIFVHFSNELNERQTKVLLRLFKEGPQGFKGGLSAEKYIAITKGSRATTTRDLQDLVLKGILLKRGELKHTRYFINENFSVDSANF